MTRSGKDIQYRRSTDGGDHWETYTSGYWWLDIANTTDKDFTHPSVASPSNPYSSAVHIVYRGCIIDSQTAQEIYYRASNNWGAEGSWLTEVPLTNDASPSAAPFVAVSESRVHVVWQDARDSNWEIYYKRNPAGDNGYASFKTDSSNGRHLVRDPSSGTFHLVTTGEDNKVYYWVSNDCLSWSGPVYLDDGWCPSLCVLGGMTLNTIVCVTYTKGNVLMYKWYDSGTGVWQTATLATKSNPGPSSIITNGYLVYVAYRANVSGTWRLLCKNFPYFSPGGAVTEIIDNTSTPVQPCLSIDGNGAVYAAWRRLGTNETYFAPRGDGTWSVKTRISRTGYFSQEPFTECWGESVFVVRSEGTGTASEIRRAGEWLSNPGVWNDIPLTNNSVPSECPTQAGHEFTTWSEWTPGPQPDIWYWRQKDNTSVAVTYNPSTWSYWPHSQMRSNDLIMQTDLWSAWTESPNPGQPPYSVQFQQNVFWTFAFGPGAGSEISDYGNYYKAFTGNDTASVYCLKRDGVIRFADKAVDFARDSLVYEFPYLDPVYDYFVKIYSYRESGSDWVQALSMDGGATRTVRFTPNLVDTVWMQIPPDAYAQDRKVVFSLRNVKGDYVTSFGLTLYQRDPKPRCKGGGPQTRGTVSMPVREVFTAYPNPTTSQTNIEYSLRSAGQVNLSVYDVAGRLVREIVSGVQPAGMYKKAWDGHSATGQQSPSGIYFVRLQSPGMDKTARIVVVH